MKSKTIAGARIEAWFTDSMLTYDTDKGLYCSPYGNYVIDINCALKFMDAELLSFVLKITKKFQQLELTIEELAIIKALQLLSPGLYLSHIYLQLLKQHSNHV